MASQLSPGVVVNEFDFSDYAQRNATAVLGIVGTATRGPCNVVTTITNERQLIDTFGKPTIAAYDSNLYSFYSSGYRATGLVAAAIRYLKYGNQVRVIRVATGVASGDPALGAMIIGTRSVQQDGTLVAAATGSTFITINANTPGAWGNNLTINLTAGTATNSFKLTITYEGVVREVFDNLAQGNGSTHASTTDENYPTVRINGVSNYITVVPNTSSVVAYPSAFPAAFSPVNGADSSSSLVAADYIGGTHSTFGAWGLELFKDTNVEINILAAAGVNAELGAIAGSARTSALSKSVEAAMVVVCEGRKDCIALLDPPLLTGASYNARTSPSQAIAFTDATGDYASGSSTNSSFAAFYWPWIRYYDNYNSKEVWGAPSGFIAGILAYTDSVSDPWFAPAGLNRAKIPSALGIQYNTTVAERDNLYGTSGRVVNPVVNFNPEGIVVWGQKTSQRRSSALDRVNVRRMLAYAEKLVATSVRVLLFEQNDEFTWIRFNTIIKPIFDAIKTRRGLTDFRVICDETTNPPALRDQNEMRGIILLKPTKAAEIITVDFVVTTTGANFTEFIPNA